jgi:phasin
MSEAPKLEIPDTFRQIAEKNVEQARAAYTQMMDMVRQAQMLLTRSSGAMTEGALDVQFKMMRFAEQNIEANFKLAGDLARARDMKEYFEIQSSHAQKQMQTYASQAQEIGRIMTELAQKAQSKS